MSQTESTRRNWQRPALLLMSISALIGCSPKQIAAPTPAPADDNSPGVPPEMPAAGVVVAEEDVRACSEAIEYAWAAYGWAATLNTPIAQAGD